MFVALCATTSGTVPKYPQQRPPLHPGPPSVALPRPRPARRITPPPPSKPSLPDLPIKGKSNRPLHETQSKVSEKQQESAEVQWIINDLQKKQTWNHQAQMDLVALIERIISESHAEKQPRERVPVPVHGTLPVLVDDSSHLSQVHQERRINSLVVDRTILREQGKDIRSEIDSQLLKQDLLDAEIGKELLMLIRTDDRKWEQDEINQQSPQSRAPIGSETPSSPLGRAVNGEEHRPPTD